MCFLNWGFCACVWLLLLGGVDERSRAPELLVPMLDVPLDKGPHPACSAFLPYGFIIIFFFPERKGGLLIGLSVSVSNQVAVNTPK